MQSTAALAETAVNERGRHDALIASLIDLQQQLERRGNAAVSAEDLRTLSAVLSRACTAVERARVVAQFALPCELSVTKVWLDGDYDFRVTLVAGGNEIRVPEDHEYDEFSGEDESAAAMEALVGLAPYIAGGAAVQCKLRDSGSHSNELVSFFRAVEDIRATAVDMHERLGVTKVEIQPELAGRVEPLQLLHLP